MTQNIKAADAGLKRNAWTVILVATIVLLTSVCGIGGYRVPPLPPPIAPAISNELPNTVALSPDGLEVVSWERESPQLKIFHTLRNGTAVVLNSSHCTFRLMAAQFSWDGKWMVGACTGSDLTVWDATTGEATHHLPCRLSPYFVAAWSRDGHYLAADCELEKITVWEFPSGKEITTLGPHNGTITQLAFTPQGQLISSSTDGWVRFKEISGRLLRSHEFGDMVKGFILRSDGKQLAVQTASITGGADIKVYIWDLDSDKLRHVNGLDAYRLGVLALSPDGSFLVLRTGNAASVFSLRQDRYTYALGDGVKAAVFRSHNQIVGITFDGIATWDCCNKNNSLVH